MSYTDEDARPDIPAEALGAARWAYAEFEGERCDAVDAAIRAAYAAGHAAGRLLPLEAETRRCPSCDHLTTFHREAGCWYSVTVGTVDRDLVCPCSVPGVSDGG